MYIDWGSKNSKYRRILLRDSYRINGKNRHHTILNLSNWKMEEIKALELALKYKDKLSEFLKDKKKNISLEQGVSIGAVHVVYEVAKGIGIVDALGKNNEGNLALWQIISRVTEQGSRLSAVRLARHHACHEVLSVGKFDENTLYKNLEWLCENQEKIEDSLFRIRKKTNKGGLFLYDLTSCYFEGEHNAFARYGYDRDGKKGKKQMLVGLLCDDEGYPVSVEVFDGNLSDMKTLSSQIKKLSKRFGGSKVTIVGDRGMIKGPQIEELKQNNIHYISAISKSQIRHLLSEGILHMELFDENVSEVFDEEGVRYILRRNPFRAEEIKSQREKKFLSLKLLVDKANYYLKNHLRANIDKAFEKILRKAIRLNIDKFVDLKLDKNTRFIEVSINEEKLAKVSELDGCYVLKTDLSCEDADKNFIHDRYKDLALVENAFRTCKTVELEIRPVFLRNEERTRAHTLVVMLAYIISKKLRECWKSLDITVQEGLGLLKTLCVTDVLVDGEKAFSIVPKPAKEISQLFSLAGVNAPTVVKEVKERADTKVKLNKRR